MCFVYEYDRERDERKMGGEREKWSHLKPQKIVPSFNYLSGMQQ